MAKVNRSIFASATLALLVLGLIIYFSNGNGEVTASAGAYFYKNPSRDISKINLKVFYTVPRNKARNVESNWREVIEKTLEKAASFHALQFRRKSELRYEVFPEIVILNRENFFYDTAVTDKGNPQALISVAEELQNRIFEPKGDLHQPDFIFKNDAYPVMGIIYEGVGASGGVIFESEKGTVEEIARELKIPSNYIFIVDVTAADGFFILARQFLTEKEDSVFGASLLYHEFAHTFGLPDLYDPKTNAVFSNDIMGAGRRRAIESTFIDRSLLLDLGVLGNGLGKN